MERDTVKCAGEIHHLTVGVTDMDASLRFYCEGLGLRKTLDTVVEGDRFELMLRMPEGSSARTVFLQGQTRLGQIELVEWRGAGPQVAEPRRAGMPGYCVVSFNVSKEDMPAICSQLENVGSTFWTEPLVSHLDGYGDILAFITEDPDGNMIEIVALPSPEEIARERAGLTGQ